MMADEVRVGEIVVIEKLESQINNRVVVNGVKQVLIVSVTFEELPTLEFQFWRVAAKLLRRRVGIACWNEHTCMLQLFVFWISRLMAMSEVLKGELLTKLTLSLRLELVGTLVMVRYCEPKLLDSVQVALVEPKLQLGLGWKRLLKVVCSDELIVMNEFDGNASLLSQKQPIDVSPTYKELRPITQLIVFAYIVTIPEFIKFTPPAEALNRKLVAKFGLVAETVRTQKVFVANALEKVIVVALLVIAQVQVDVVPLTRQGLRRMKSVVKLRMSVLVATVVLVSILISICWSALTWLLEGVMSMMRCELTRYALSKAIIISILLQISVQNDLGEFNSNNKHKFIASISYQHVAD